MNIIGTTILASFILVTVPLNIQAECYCPGPSEEPYVPCGYCEGEYEMAYSRIEIKTYLDGVQTYMKCLGECIEKTSLNAENVIDRWNSAVEQYSIR